MINQGYVKEQKKMKYLTFGFLIMFVLMISQVFGSVQYDPDSNTIYLIDGNNTLQSMYEEINNPSVLDYDSSTNTYTLTAYMCGMQGYDADLEMTNATLVFNNTALDTYNIKTYSDLVIDSMLIKSVSQTYPWRIWGFARWTSYSAIITNSQFENGHIFISPNGWQTPSSPIVIRNNIFCDYIANGGYSSLNDPSQGALALKQDAAVDAIICNNTFYNIHLSTYHYHGILILNGYTGCLVDSLFITDCSTTTYGMTYCYGTAGFDSPPRFSNFLIEDVEGYGLTGKEYGNVIYNDGTIRNITGNAIHFYHSSGYGNTWFWVWNVVIDSANYGITNNGADSITADIYNCWINNVSQGFHILNNAGYVNFFATNCRVTNYNQYAGVTGHGQLLVYELVDVFVKDLNDNPIENTTITIIPEQSHSNPYYCINRKVQPIDQTATLLNGHTPLPHENDSLTVVLLRRKITSSVDSSYTYTIKATYSSVSDSVVGIAPDTLWYRTNPDSYPGVPEKGTITITLPVEIADTTALDRILVYPNPYRADMGWPETIFFDNLPGKVTIKIYTITGELIQEIEHEAEIDGGKEEWNISDIASGIYIYSVKSQSGKKVGKVCIIK